MFLQANAGRVHFLSWYAFAAFALCTVTILTLRAPAQWVSRDSRVTTVGINDVRFVDSLHGWACGNDAVMLNTTNGGRSWNWVESDWNHNICWFNCLPPGYWNSKSAIHGGGKLWAASRYSTLWYSKDTGVTWSEFDPYIIHFREITSVAANGHGDIFCAGGSKERGEDLILASRDKGLTFSPVILPTLLTGLDWHLQVTALRFIDSTTVEATLFSPGNGKRILVSTDCGDTWDSSRSAPHWMPTKVWLEASNYWKINPLLESSDSTQACSDSILRSSDGGITWELLNMAFLQSTVERENSTHGLNNVVVAFQRMFVFVSGQSNLYYITNDAGKHWEKNFLPWAGADSVCRMKRKPALAAWFRNEAYGLLLGYLDSSCSRCAIWVTRDSARHWEMVADMGDAIVQDDFLACSILRKGPDVWAVPANGTIWHSADFGLRWTNDSVRFYSSLQKIDPVLGITLLDDSTVCAFGRNGLLLSQHIVRQQWLNDFGEEGHNRFPAGLNDMDDLTFYPNPCSQTTTLRLRRAQPATVTIMLYDSFGKTVQIISDGWNFSAPEGKIPLSFSSLNPGSYFCLCHTPTGMLSARLVITK